MSAYRIKITDHMIGNDCEPFIVAEAGINHNGDMELARRLIKAAADAGADAIKFQNYRTEDFISDKSLKYEYVLNGKKIIESQYDMFKRCELTLAQFLQLKKWCDDSKLVFFSTPTSEEGVEELIKIGAPLLKNGSDYLGHLPMIQKMAKTGVPTLISTGMATPDEITDAVNAFREAGGKDLILLHCVSSYPTPPNDVNLKKIPVLQKTYDCPVGFSDHTEGVLAAIGSVILGSCLIEKHFTLDKNLPGPDHHFSSDPLELKLLVDSVKMARKNLGSDQIGPVSSEKAGRSNFKLSCVAAKNMPAGHKIAKTDIVFRRPGNGLAPKEAPLFIGRVLACSVNLAHVFKKEDFL